MSSKRTMPACETLCNAIDRIAPTLKEREELYDLVGAFHEAVIEDVREELQIAKGRIVAKRSAS